MTVRRNEPSRHRQETSLSDPKEPTEPMQPQPPTPDAALAANDIALRAYLLWENEGRPEGRAFDHWLQAEAELKAISKGPVTPFKEVTTAIYRDDRKHRPPRAVRNYAVRPKRAHS